MPKKEWTPEERAAFGAKMKEKREAKKQEMQEVENPNPTPTPAQQDNNDVQLLLDRIAELEKRAFFQQPQQQQPYTPVRSITKYSIVPKDYPDPRERLFQEERLKLKNFNDTWWALEYRVDKVQYDRDGVHYVEPRFTLELWHIMETEDGEPSNKRYKVCTGMFFEDPDSFVTIAHDKGINVPDELHKDFMDEMRYMGMRDWLIEAFYPPKPSQEKTNKTETVIGNRLVEVVEINSTEAENAFKHLTSKA